jgi:hypothetical protein
MVTATAPMAESRAHDAIMWLQPLPSLPARAPRSQEHGARKAGDATTNQAAQEGEALETAGAVGVVSCRHLKSSKHDLRDDRFCHGAGCSSWRSQMDMTVNNCRITLSKDST